MVTVAPTWNKKFFDRLWDSDDFFQIIFAGKTRYLPQFLSYSKNRHTSRKPLEFSIKSLSMSISCELPFVRYRGRYKKNLEIPSPAYFKGRWHWVPHGSDWPTKIFFVLGDPFGGDLAKKIWGRCKKSDWKRNSLNKRFKMVCITDYYNKCFRSIIKLHGRNQFSSIFCSFSSVSKTLKSS